MSNVVALRGGSMPAAFASQANLPNMNAAGQAGLQASFAVIGFKGRNWRIKHRGDEQLVMDDRGQPAGALDVVIVGISDSISKQYYEKKFAEGDSAAPDCFSIDGKVPDPASPKKQHNTCATCPMNAWGSKITDAGKKAKACQDSRRVAVVPYGDIENETYGGPMMLRLPPTSLGNLANYTRDLGRFGAQPYMVGTKLKFDYNVAYPLIEFAPINYLDNDQAAQAIEVLQNPLIERMLKEEIVEATHDEAEPAAVTPSPLAAGGPSTAFAQVVAPVHAEEPVAVPAPEVLPPAAPTPVVAKKPSPFNTAAAPQAVAPTPVVAAPAPAEAVQTAPEPVAKVVVQQAPSDMAAAIDELLGG